MRDIGLILLGLLVVLIFILFDALILWGLVNLFCLTFNINFTFTFLQSFVISLIYKIVRIVFF